MIADWFATFGLGDWIAFVIGIVFAVISLDLFVAYVRVRRQSAAVDQVDGEVAP